jgi:ribose/xylose/arabinose/galactoside ABC-type transport system permease subunit
LTNGAGFRWRGPAARPSGLIRRFGLWAVLVLVVVAFMIASPTFRQTINLENVLEQNAIIGIVACGMAVMMIAGGFDLSVGAVGATSAVAAAWVSESHGTILAILAGLAVGLVTGAINGLLVAKVKLNAFIANLRDGQRRVRAPVRGHRRAVLSFPRPAWQLSRPRPRASSPAKW